MDNSSDTPNPATRRDALKSAIKATLREMIADAAGRTQIPNGTLNPEDARAEYRARLRMMDFLLTPPWARTTTLTLNQQEMEKLDADVDRFGQVDAEEYPTLFPVSFLSPEGW